MNERLVDVGRGISLAYKEIGCAHCARSARAVIGLWPDAFPYLRCSDCRPARSQASLARWPSSPALLVRGRHRRPITPRSCRYRPALTTWLLLAATSPRTRTTWVAGSVPIFRRIGSHGFPFDEAWVREQAGLAWDRDASAPGGGRVLAIFRSGDRTAALRAITAPTLVIHGDRDRMVHPTGAAATARAIPGARLETIRGMGHDLPRGAWPVLIDLIDDHARRNTRRTDAA
jgi:hypothetical protein